MIRLWTWQACDKVHFLFINHRGKGKLKMQNNSGNIIKKKNVLLELLIYKTPIEEKIFPETPQKYLFINELRVPYKVRNIRKVYCSEYNFLII